MAPLKFQPNLEIGIHSKDRHRQTARGRTFQFQGYDERRPSEHQTHCFLSRLELVMPAARGLLAVMRNSRLGSSCSCRTTFSSSQVSAQARAIGVAVCRGRGACVQELAASTVSYEARPVRRALLFLPCCSPARLHAVQGQASYDKDWGSSSSGSLPPPPHTVVFISCLLPGYDETVQCLCPPLNTALHQAELS